MKVVPILTDAGVFVMALTIPLFKVNIFFKSEILLPATIETIRELDKNLFKKLSTTVFN